MPSGDRLSEPRRRVCGPGRVLCVLLSPSLRDSCCLEFRAQAVDSSTQSCHRPRIARDILSNSGDDWDCSSFRVGRAVTSYPRRRLRVRVKVVSSEQKQVGPGQRPWLLRMRPRAQAVNISEFTAQGNPQATERPAPRTPFLTGRSRELVIG